MWQKIQCLLVGLLVSVFLIRPAFAVPMFPDVDESSEYAEAITYVSEAGIMVGDSSGNFNPDKIVTRAEMTAIICRMLGEAEGLEKSSVFSDVPTSHWASAYVSKAVEYGIVTGYSNGNFGPNDDVTYEQGVTMIIRAVGGEIEAQDCGGYPEGYFAVANENDLLKNVSVNRGESLSRANIAVIIYNCIG